jgi:hypothetical protein
MAKKLSKEESSKFSPVFFFFNFLMLSQKMANFHHKKKLTASAFLSFVGSAKVKCFFKLSIAIIRPKFKEKPPDFLTWCQVGFFFFSFVAQKLTSIFSL